MSRTLLLGLGDDTGAPEPAGTAKRLADGLGLRIVVVHAPAAIAPPHVLLAPQTGGVELGAGVGNDPTAVPPQPYADVERGVRDRCAELGFGDAVVVVEAGRAPADLLRAIADEHDAELIVVGSRGRGSMKAAFLGSTAHALVTRAPCPVVVVPLVDDDDPAA